VYPSRFRIIIYTLILITGLRLSRRRLLKIKKSVIPLSYLGYYSRVLRIIIDIKGKLPVKTNGATISTIVEVYLRIATIVLKINRKINRRIRIRIRIKIL